MRRHGLDWQALNQVGIRLLPEESVETAMELEGGIPENLEKRRTTFVLTNKRLIRYSVGGQTLDVVSTCIGEGDTIEVKRTARTGQWVSVGLVFIAGGLLLGLMSLMYLSSPISPLLMAVSLTLIGIVFMLTYLGGMTGQIIVRAGVKEIKCRMNPHALDEMSVFVQRFHELKLGDSRASISDHKDSHEAAGAAGELTPTGLPQSQRPTP